MIVMLIIYEFLLAIYALVSLPILIFEGKWHPGFKERFGLLSPDLKNRLREQQNIWIHAVSVGEVVAVISLLRQLKARLPQYRIVLSVSTKTGYELAVKSLSNEALVIWAPLDFGLTVREFVRAIAPAIYIAAETELWPNLFTVLAKRKIPMVVVNGRISDKSYGSYRTIGWFMRGFLPLVNVFCMQSDEDVERIVSLGAPPAKVHNVGNVKFDDLPAPASLRTEDLGFAAGDDLWVAGSTHPGEEEIVLEVFKNLRAAYSRLRLVIAPRHVERADDILKLTESKGLACRRFSSIKTGPRQADVVVVDSIGQLRALYSLAAIVFVGKSFTVPGGHNIIEPAFFSKPVIVGPHMQNFKDITAVFNKEQAIAQLNHPQELEGAVKNLLDSPHARAVLGDKARAVINRYTGATRRSVDYILGAMGQGR